MIQLNNIIHASALKNWRMDQKYNSVLKRFWKWVNFETLARIMAYKCASSSRSH